ncbi:hypothetical protein [Streptomyces wuyuanensis]|uniref:hypothetical protein n=1 Tax=Streptomyces wuyuanensis TaxID=1196353 RepID=UPI00371B140A
MQNLVIAGVCIAVLVVWDLAGHLPLPLGVAGHEGSTVLVGLNGLRLLRESAWRRAASPSPDRACDGPAPHAPEQPTGQAAPSTPEQPADLATPDSPAASSRS